MSLQFSEMIEKASTSLLIKDPDEKVKSVYSLKSNWKRETGKTEIQLKFIDVIVPGRPDFLNIVHKKDLPRRGIGTAIGHAAFVHALTHIEFEAINLALDIIYRFTEMPLNFYTDWIQLCGEECSHFEMLRSHLQTLGYSYGDFPVHDDLWDLSQLSKHSLLERLALIPRMAEARGLDVTASMQSRLLECGHTVTSEKLQTIYEEEIGHVQTGSKWFLYLCGGSQEIACKEYISILNKYGFTEFRKPLNRTARLKAGFSEQELAYLESCSS